MYGLFDEHYNSKVLIKYFIKNIINDLVLNYNYKNNKDILVLMMFALTTHGFKQIQLKQ